ncbi:MAG: uncharacterized protein PWP08_1274 [Methanofollis sp.]|nr:uncharacterized protein [Methanofollis sp.]
MTEEGAGPCRRGRRRAERIIDGRTNCSCFFPQCGPDAGEPVILRPEEIEALRLVDLLGMQQEEAAEAMGVSRKTLWRDLHEARRKVAGAIVNGRAILMEECGRTGERRCRFGECGPRFRSE